MQDSYVPQSLDVPERYLIFTADELMVVVAPLLVCIILFNFLVGLVVAALALWILRQFKRGGSLNRLKWRAYWILPSDAFRLKATPPSYLREMAG